MPIHHNHTTCVCSIIKYPQQTDLLVVSHIPLHVCASCYISNWLLKLHDLRASWVEKEMLWGPQIEESPSKHPSDWCEKREICAGHLKTIKRNEMENVVKWIFFSSNKAASRQQYTSCVLIGVSSWYCYCYFSLHFINVVFLCKSQRNRCQAGWPMQHNGRAIWLTSYASIILNSLTGTTRYDAREVRHS